MKNKSDEPDFLVPKNGFKWLELRFSDSLGSGRLIIGDSPTWQCDLDILVNDMGYDTVFDFYNEREKGRIIKRKFRDLVISSGDEYGKKSQASTVLLWICSENQR